MTKVQGTQLVGNKYSPLAASNGTEWLKFGTLGPPSPVPDAPPAEQQDYYRIDLQEGERTQ
jgi:hypothetical protein